MTRAKPRPTPFVRDAARAKRAKQLLDFADALPVDDRIKVLEAIEAECTRRLVKLRLERVER